MGVRLVQPLLRLVGRLLDEAYAHGALGHPLGHQKRNERAAESDDGGHQQQGLQIQVDAIFLQDAFESEDLKYDTDDYQYGGVARQEQEYSHDFLRSSSMDRIAWKG